MTKTLAVLATLAASLALAGCGGGSDEASEAETPPPTTQQAETEAASATTAVPTTSTEPTTDEADGGSEPGETSETNTAVPAETEAPEEAPVVVTVEGGQPVGGVQTITVKSGDQVRFTVRADAPEEVHVHGFDISKDVGPGEDAAFAFPADIEGIFEVELENSAVQIIKLVVEP
jgi:FtsP/CotA-like multicopper oxidase with cupredoxin domain